MEIKYTIEILTKDIQDIEKLVGNLRNSKEASAIELDLALSKLRNVYEILTMIKADRLHELVGNIPEQEKPPTGTAPSLKLEPEAETEHKPVPKPEPEPEPKQIPEPEAEPEPEIEPEPAPAAKPETAASTQTDSSSILAEKFSAESSINENLAEKFGNDPNAKLVGQPIDNISRNIGINDRFFIIRELFEGESDRFTSLVNALDSAESYQAASSILKEQFAENMDHEGVEILSGLLKRRYIR
jgi:hypothetical protein